MAVTLPRPDRRRALQSAAAGVVVLALLLWWLLPVGGGEKPEGKVTFATGVSTGVYQTYGEMLKRDLSRDLPDVDVTLLETRGSPDNVERLARGRATFAIAATDAVAAYHGRDGRDRLRACARLYDDYMQLVVPRGSTVRSARGSAGQAGRRRAGRLGRTADTRAAAQGRRARFRQGHHGRARRHRHDAGAAAEGQAGRLLLVGRAADHRGAQQLAGEYPIRLVQLGDLDRPAAPAGRR